MSVLCLEYEWERRQQHQIIGLVPESIMNASIPINVLAKLCKRANYFWTLSDTARSGNFFILRNKIPATANLLQLWISPFVLRPLFEGIMACSPEQLPHTTQPYTLITDTLPASQILVNCPNNSHNDTNGAGKAAHIDLGLRLTPAVPWRTWRV